MRNIEDIKKDIASTREQLQKLIAERQNVRLSNISSPKYDPHAIYKFRFPTPAGWGDSEYVGVINHIWYSEESDAYMIEFCGLVNNLSHDNKDFADCQWSCFDADLQYEIKDHNIKKFINNLQAISYQEFREYYHNTFIPTMTDRIQYWIESLINEENEKQ